MLLLPILAFGCFNVLKISDLQDEGYSYPNNTQKARSLLREMATAHQVHRWDSIDTYNVIFEDEFYGFFGKQMHAFKEQEMQFSINYIPKTFDGQLEIICGNEKG